MKRALESRPFPAAPHQFRVSAFGMMHRTARPASPHVSPVDYHPKTDHRPPATKGFECERGGGTLLVRLQKQEGDIGGATVGEGMLCRSIPDFHTVLVAAESKAMASPRRAVSCNTMSYKLYTFGPREAAS